MAIWQFLHENAARQPDRLAVIHERCQLTYAELEDWVERIATGLHFQGLAGCDRVVTVLGNTPEHLALLLACFRAGLVVVPLAPWSILAQIRYALRTSGARGIVAPTATLQAVFEDHGELRPDIIINTGDPLPIPGMIPWEVIEAGPGEVPPLPKSDRDHLAIIVFTSGTTSRPKAVVHSQNRLARRVIAYADRLQLTPRDVAYIIIGIGRPVVLAGQVLAMLRCGGTIVLRESCDPAAFWEGFRQPPQKTLTFGAPGVMKSLLAHPASREVDWSQCPYWLVGGDCVSPELHAGFIARAGRPLIEMCGMTETGFYSLNPPDRPRIGSIGQVLPGVTVRIVDAEGTPVSCGEIGEIAIRTPDGMIGYWNDTAETFRVIRDDWLYTGDLARMDADGYLWFVGRSKDIIVRMGYKVSPILVEQALETHPSIERAVVVGAPDSLAGQVPFAFLQLAANQPAPNADELRTYLADRLDPPSIPDSFVPIAEWPLTYAGKLDRARLVWIATNGGVPF
ncbi:class I adenylate-forming enzyme family protein [Tuwongella immobilis]|uniref:AMP-dependent synthetase/ligase domain-containing protein n=1 Tax=Tuwongella immobilis TaxID=692036 RepID=A0A6C2YW18_9BACT|nr:class I adenylate-forming enzyme family protein [Tuwongella immobilis]VIP05644.1 acid-- ligase : Acyl-CoA synthetase (AMP-forming)/AMP-acid ligase II OS=Desulfovibrio magneticus str. Maddingley MBC34 GN=B193_1945 PE=4 SV=1: AMP-binding: AMP-binding_C [Tuwongella immobilis]VTS08644.1 acid-- ligase : Acyl-CoA synthetase (AMP-forming)/AMP-acid ligase II OS=Desulfovibrio magneticus str. Maddingley MBC34 GN=B193_1945 PE=4 SV=1: AMP-binding: AMP-binding_C [Tuwongella immobilis]